MANEIKIKRGSGSDPGSSDLSVGELAIRTDTAKLFTKNDAGSVAEIGGGTDNTKMPLAGGTFTGDVVFSGAGTSITFDQSTDDFVFADGAKAVFGTGLDLQIYHNSSDGNSHIRESGSGCLVLNTNCLRVKNAAHTENLIAADENGNVQLYYDNSKKFETTSSGINVTNNITCTSGSDLVLNSTGRVQLQVSDGEKAVYCDNDGAVELYFNNVKKFETTSDGVTLRGTIHRFEGTIRPNSGTGSDIGTTSDRIRDIFVYNDIDIKDDGKVMLGDSNDLEIYHNGTNSYIDNHQGDLYIRGQDDHIILQPVDGESAIVCDPNGAVNLYHDNALKFQTTANGVQIDGRLFTNGADYNYLTSNSSTNATLTLKKTDSNADSIDYLQLRNNANSAKFIINGDGSVVMYDNSKLKLGNSADLQIYHDGSDSFIEDTGTGALILKAAPSLSLRSDTVNINNNANSENMARFFANGAVELYFDNTKRLETVDDGVQVIGNLGINRDGALAYGSTSTILEARASDASNSIFESATFRGGADHNGAGARVRIVQGTHRGLVLEGGRTSNAAFGAIGITDQTGSITSSVHIDSAGTWFWGKTSQSSGTPGVELYKDGPHFMTRSAGGGTVLGLNDSTGTSGGIMKFYFQDVHKGSLQFTGSTFQTATASDYRLKENDVAISDGITRLKLLRPVRFNWKTDASKTYDGFIAHEVTPAVPEAVVGEKDGEISKRGEGYQMICQQTLIPLLTAALKEAVSKIELLEARVTTLEAA